MIVSVPDQLVLYFAHELRLPKPEATAAASGFLMGFAAARALATEPLLTFTDAVLLSDTLAAKLLREEER